MRPVHPLFHSSACLFTTCIPHSFVVCLFHRPALAAAPVGQIDWSDLLPMFFFYFSTSPTPAPSPSRVPVSLIVILSQEVSVMRVNCVFGVRGAEQGVGRGKDWMMRSVCNLGILQTNRKHRPTSRWTRTENRKADRLPFILHIISSFCAQNQSGLGLVISQWTGKVSYFVGCRELGEQKHFFSSLCISASLCGHINCAAVCVCKPSLNEMCPLFTAPLSR